MEKNLNFVYVTTNLINRKQYIGDHSTNYLNDNYKGSGILISKAFKKYGKENFDIKILEEFDTKENAFNSQEKYITKFNTLQPLGYNISPKGGSKFQGSCSNETKEKLSKSHIGKKHTKEAIEKISEELRKRKRKPETYQKISAKQKGIKKIDKFIELYGIDEGTKRFEQWKQKFKKRDPEKYKTLKVKYIDKYGEEEGIKLYKEYRREIARKSHIGIKQTEETKEKRAKKLRGLKRTKETKLKMSLAAKGKSKNYNVWNKHKMTINITPEIIKEVRNVYKSGKTQQELAIMYNFSSSCISRIIRGFYDNKIYVNSPWKIK